MLGVECQVLRGLFMKYVTAISLSVQLVKLSHHNHLQITLCTFASQLQ